MKKITLDYFRKKYKHGINKGICMFDIVHYLNDTFDIKLDFDVWLESRQMNLQRGLCWSQLQKEQLILTLLKRGEIDKFTCIQYREGPGVKGKETILYILDGKQRFTTILSFCRNEFPLYIENQEYFFKDLDDKCQREILGFSPKWDVHYSYGDQLISEQTMIDIFEEVNFLGTPQDINHLKRLKQ